LIDTSKWLGRGNWLAGKCGICWLVVPLVSYVSQRRLKVDIICFWK
jgi:hypothetical protein